MGKLSPEEFKKLLQCWSEGDDHALDEVLKDVYDYLKGVANHLLRNERKGHTLQPTALVHEAFLKVGKRPKIEWASREHFVAVFAIAMRRVLVDHARKRNAQKGPGNVEFFPLDEALIYSPQRSSALLALDEGLTKLTDKAPRRARVVELRVFGGLTNDEIASLLGISSNTVMRDWDQGLAELGGLIQDGNADDPGPEEKS